MPTKWQINNVDPSDWQIPRFNGTDVEWASVFSAGRTVIQRDNISYGDTAPISVPSGATGGIAILVGGGGGSESTGAVIRVEGYVAATSGGAVTSPLNLYGGGGGGGGSCVIFFDLAMLGSPSSLYFTIGAGGSPGSNGDPTILRSGPTIFDSVIGQANGGLTGSAYAGGLGGGTTITGEVVPAVYFRGKRGDGPMLSRTTPIPASFGGEPGILIKPDSTAGWGGSRSSTTESGYDGAIVILWV